MFLKGNEPIELTKHINFLMKELHESYPEGLITSNTWKHEQWDSLVNYLYPKLGYKDEVSFLGEYGFDVFGELDTHINEVSTRQQEKKQEKMLICPICASNDIMIETFQENIGTTTVTKQKFKFKQRGHGLIWWLIIGWWWWIFDLCLWLFMFPIRFLIQLFRKKKYKGKATSVSQSVNEIVYKKVYTCKACGHTWIEIAGSGSTVSAVSKSKDNIKKLKRTIK